MNSEALLRYSTSARDDEPTSIAVPRAHVLGWGASTGILTEYHGITKHCLILQRDSAAVCKYNYLRDAMKTRREAVHNLYQSMRSRL